MSLNKLKPSGMEWCTVSTIQICSTKLVVNTWVYANSQDCLHLDFLLFRPAMSLWIFWENVLIDYWCAGQGTWFLPSSGLKYVRFYSEGVVWGCVGRVRQAGILVSTVCNIKTLQVSFWLTECSNVHICVHHWDKPSLLCVQYHEDKARAKDIMKAGKVCPRQFCIMLPLHYFSMHVPLLLPS